MRDYLHSVIKRAVGLDVYVFVTYVGSFKQFLCIIIVLACSVNFKLNAKISVRISVENRLWFVAVIVDTMAFAALTIRIVVPDSFTAVIANRCVVVDAVRTQGLTVEHLVIVRVNVCSQCEQRILLFSIFNLRK